MKLFAAGAAQAKLGLYKVREIEIPCPSPPTQRKIAAILSAYDHLIENNVRRIGILERMAQLLYHEWFVRFRFPGHEDVEMVESELGPIPAGWEVKAIGEAIDTLGGGTPSTKRESYWEAGDINWYTPSDLTSNNSMFISSSSRKINALGLQKSSAKMFPAYSVMMTSRATVGIVSINTTPACTNQGFITCVPSDRLSSHYLYSWIGQNREKIIALASGATFKEINKTTFREIPILIPDSEIHDRFVEIVEPIAAEIQNSSERNAILRRTRDLLLPRLVSGEVDVAELEIAV